MSIVCFLVNHVRARLELARQPELADCLGVIVDRSTRKSIVLDYLPAGPAAVTGMPLERVREIEPDAIVIEADESYYRHQFKRMLCALERVSDRVEGAELGVAYVGLGGTSVMSDELL